MYTDDSIFQYIDSKATQIQQQQEDISPFMFGSAMNSGQYTYITQDGNGYESTGDVKKDMIHNQNFVLLGVDQRIIAPVDKEGESKTNKFDSSLLERYMDSRKNDDEQLKKILNSNQSYNRIM
jgi:hypothetical protein